MLGIGFSLAQLRSLAEEFGGINDAIRGATRELGDQSEIQQKILKGAQDCREEYGAMAGSVTKLIQQNGKLFPVDDAVKFVSLVEKHRKGCWPGSEHRQHYGRFDRGHVLWKAGQN